MASQEFIKYAPLEVSAARDDMDLWVRSIDFIYFYMRLILNNFLYFTHDIWTFRKKQWMKTHSQMK